MCQHPGQTARATTAKPFQGFAPAGIPLIQQSVIEARTVRGVLLGEGLLSPLVFNVQRNDAIDDRVWRVLVSVRCGYGPDQGAGGISGGALCGAGAGERRIGGDRVAIRCAVRRGWGAGGGLGGSDRAAGPEWGEWGVASGDDG